jgi:hypothetical protein
MSETTITSPHEAAIAVITERANALDAEILGHQRCIDVATASRNELLELVATLSRKPRARKPRAVAESGSQAEDTQRPAVDAAPRPSVFGAVPVPANDEAGEQAGEEA